MYMLSRTRKKLEIVKKWGLAACVPIFGSALFIEGPKDNPLTEAETSLRGSFELARNYFPQIASFRIPAIYIVQPAVAATNKVIAPIVDSAPDVSASPSTEHQKLQLLLNNSLFPDIYRNVGFDKNMTSNAVASFEPYNKPIYSTLKQDGPL